MARTFGEVKITADDPQIDGGMDSAGSEEEMGGITDGMGDMGGMMMGMLGILGAIKVVMKVLEPIFEAFEVFIDVLQAFIQPLAAMLIKMLSPVLRWMIQLLPYWMDFLEDPQAVLVAGLRSLWDWIKANLPGYIIKGFKTLIEWYFKMIVAYLKIWAKIGQILWKGLKRLGSWMWEQIKQLPRMMWDFMKSLPSMIADVIRGAVPGADRIPFFQSGGVMKKPGLAHLEAGEAAIPAGDFRRLMNVLRNGQGGGVHIEFSGGIADIIRTEKKNPNTRR